MLLLAMISLHMLTFWLMVTMVAEFRSFIFLIHNTLQGEITISSTRTTRVLYLYSLVGNDHMQRLILWLLSYASSREEDEGKV